MGQYPLPWEGFDKESRGDRINNGLILIPDISGYTEFVYSAELNHAQRIVSVLLESMINTREIDLELCEIEGDALLCFLHGDPPPFKRIRDQIYGWHRAFHSTLDQLNKEL